MDQGGVLMMTSSDIWEGGNVVRGKKGSRVDLLLMCNEAISDAKILKIRTMGLNYIIL